MGDQQQGGFQQQQGGFQQPRQQFAQPDPQAQFSNPQYAPQPSQPAQTDWAVPDQFGGAQMGMAAGMAANLGKDYADQYRDAATAELTKLGFGLDSLRRYFAVDNSYVRARLMLLLFPWPIGSRKTKDWRRLHSTPDPNAPEKTIPMQPREDENAPDLYIPFMAFVTYVLAAGFWLGVAGTFTPEILAQSFSSSLVVWFIEVVLTKGALYLM